MKRGLLFFLGALLLGSLTVVGQDDDPDAAIKGKVEELTRLLQRRAAARARVEGRQRVSMRMYDVSDLTAPITDSTLDYSNLIPSRYQRPESGADMEPRSPYQVDWLIELIRTTVEPETWDTIESADIMAKNGWLFVNTIPRVHERIVKSLTEFRTYLEPQVAVDLVAVRVDQQRAAVLARTPRDLDPAAAEALLQGDRLGTLRLLCFDGQQVVSREGSERSYLQDFDVEIAQSAKIGDPIRQSVFDGFSAEVRAILDRNRGGAVLHCRIERTDFRDPIRRVATEHGPVELPALGVTRLSASCWVPLDTPVVLGGAVVGDGSCVFIAIVRKFQGGK